MNFRANMSCPWSNLSSARPKVITRIGFGAGYASFRELEAVEISCAISRIFGSTQNPDTL